MRKGQQGVVKGIFYNTAMKPNLLSVEFDSGQCCMVYADALFLVVVEKPKGFALGDRVRLTKDMKPWAAKHQPGVVVGLTQTFNPVGDIVISVEFEDVEFEDGMVLVVPVDSLEPALPAQATQAAPQDPSVVFGEAKAAMDTLKHLGYIYKGGMWTPPAVDPVVAAMEADRWARWERRLKECTLINSALHYGATCDQQWEFTPADRALCWDRLMAAIKNYNKIPQKP
jgi:hypothetical protein